MGDLLNAEKGAHISPCGTYRWTLWRTWDDRPRLLVCMFNPSTANAEQDDPTIRLLCQIASHNGYGGITVVNLLPLRCSHPEPALKMLAWQETREWSDRDRLGDNLGEIIKAAKKSRAVLIAWGALADQCWSWADMVREEIETACLETGARLYCLGRTAGGYPKHPMARGKHKVPKDAKLIPWVTTPENPR